MEGCLPLVDIPGTTYKRLWRWASEWWQTACWCCPAREEAAPQYLEARQLVTWGISPMAALYTLTVTAWIISFRYIFYQSFKRRYTADNKVSSQTAQMSSDLWTAHLQPPSAQRPQWQPVWRWQLLCCWWCCPWWSAGGNTARLPGDNKRIRLLYIE